MPDARAESMSAVQTHGFLIFMIDTNQSELKNIKFSFSFPSISEQVPLNIYIIQELVMDL